MTEPPEPSNEAAGHALPAGLIHDLRTPLNQVLGYTEMLIERAQEADQDGFVPDMEKVHAAGQRLLAMINHHFLPIRAPDTPAATETKSDPRGAAHEGVGEISLFDPAAGPVQGRLLVVDDIEANRDVLSRRLQRQGYEVATADNGREALEKLRGAPFDLVLLDIMMPEMDGYEVLQRLKADDALRHLPVIMISALSEFDSVVRCIEMGAEDYLTKPFNPTLLKARIGACLEKKRAHDREAQLFTRLDENYHRLQKLEKLRDDLTNMIIHDLRTPLNVVILGLTTVAGVGDLNDGQREMLGIALNSSRTLAGMISDLLEIGKMESGSLQLQLQEISAPDLIDAAVKQVAMLAKTYHLMLELEPGLPRLMGDEAQLLRILVNLLGNAIKFTPPGGAVTIGVRPDHDGQSLRFFVRDTGEGIPSEAFGLIFEKFGQVESRLAGRAMSTGLGLAFCKLAVAAHGGHIGVESVPGRGSTFSFTIPLTSPA